MTSKKNTHVICILDRSGSMGHLEQETISGYNAFVDEFRVDGKLPGKGFLTLVLFDDQYDVVYKRRPINSVPELTKDTYFARGYTRLHDAIGKTLTPILTSGKHKKNKKIVLIMTDGMENDSKEYDGHVVASLVEKCKKKGWDFFYLGADENTFAHADAIGITKAHTVTYNPTVKGTARSYNLMAETALASASGELDEDFNLTDAYAAMLEDD